MIAATSDTAAAAALASVPGIGPRRLRHLLDRHDPMAAWEGLRTGALDPGVGRLVGATELARIRRAAQRISIDQVVAACATAGVDVRVLGAPGYPAELAGDVDAPAVLFTRGDPAVLAGRRVAIVGTRNATASGLATARDLGAGLADAGVVVVSGLARGIDGAAHRGVRQRGGVGVGVVGNGLDQPYPRRNAELWEWVGVDGLLISEWPPGTPPDAWRFPQRNRVIAALSELVVVVESRARGGSLITVDAAIKRGVEVMAVPGSPRCRAAEGTNHLLVEGAAPVTCVDDVLVALGLDHRHRYPSEPVPDRPDDEREVLAACREGPCTLDDLVAALGRSIGQIAIAVARLERDGCVVESDGWFELAGSRLGGR